ncbi:transposase [Butyrivibrio sp. NC2007]|uniref:transposase n=1 Tax=Butyrivibrio sp. NC2007 TaxID=1280683 RepID=UPI0003B72DE9|nr:transposase [Butyrivibrio sp. NC2007]
MQRRERHYKTEDGETVNYHTDVLEAKLYIGNNRVISLANEFIENTDADRSKYKHMSADKIKQDCEIKAFKRLAANLKKQYPRLPIIIVADSLYASDPVMEICKGNHWDYIIRFKDGSIPSIAEEYNAIPEKNRTGHIEYVNEIDYRERKVNLIRFYEDVVENGKQVHREFQWLTSITITDKNAKKISTAGRTRWKIENQGFNRQKNWAADITHACSHDANAFKKDYLLMQITDIVRQLYEWFCLKKLGIVYHVNRMIQNIYKKIVIKIPVELILNN